MADRQQKKPSSGKWVGIIIALMLFAPELLGVLVVLGLLILPIYLLQKNVKSLLGECPKIFCFHKDKGEHHLRRGREIDPWDRPDIDISKYQRK